MNADGYISTGQGVIGTNMFAYCGNNPVIRSDPSGKFGVASLILVAVTFVVLSSCYATAKLADAPDLNRSTASNNSYNCYGNAVGKQTFTNPTGYKKGDSTEKTYEAVKKDVGANNVRRLDSVNDSINENENLVALKCGPDDYHFMVREDGIWYNKPGGTPLIINESLDIVTADKWTGRYLNSNGKIHTEPSLYYDDETIYFALVKEWDKN